MVIWALRPFLCSPSVYSYHLFLISSASVSSLPFLFFIVPIFAWNVHLLSPVFLKRSLVFPILLFSSIYLQCSLKKAFLSLLAILWNSTFRWEYLFLCPLPFTSLLCSAVCKDSSDNHLPSCISFSLRRFWSPPTVQCYKTLSIVLLTVCLPDLIFWIYSHLRCIIIKDFI